MIKKACILSLIVLFLVSFNMVFAEETLNETLEIEECYNVPIMSNDGELNQNSIDNSENLLQNEELNEESYIEIYVGQNKTVDGDGSADNPFATLNLACNNVSGQNRAIVNIYNGTYYLDSHLKFNTSNLLIKGIGTVTIKNADNNKQNNVDNGKAFGLISNSANFTISNIIFDATEYSAGYMDQQSFMTFPRLMNITKRYFFFPFYGETAMGNFINCSFMGFILRSDSDRAVLNGLEYNSSFIDCYFDNYDMVFMADIFHETGEYGVAIHGARENTVHTFKNCIFSNPPIRLNSDNSYEPNAYVFLDDCWFGSNTISSSIYNVDFGKGQVIISRYAVFNVVENYLGNNRYEIIGKLTWNGTDNQDGMENFQHMTVTLKSENNDYAEIVTLTNGSFRTIYESDAKEHELTVTLDKQPIELLFNTTDIIVEPVSIYYGQDQNITVNFSQIINSTVSITINNKTYNVKVNDSNTLTYSIQDMRLKEGNYTVDIILNDDINHVWGINSTEFKVSKVSDYLFEPNIPEGVKVGDIVPITIELPADATGNLTVYVGFDEIPFTETVSGTTTVNISELTLGNNKITILYSGDDKFVTKSSPAFIYVEKVSDYDLNITVPEKNIVGDDVTITIDLPKDINDEVTLIIDGERQEVPINNGVAEYTIKNISSGSHTITAIYSGNQRYDFNVNNKVFTVDKIQTTLKVESINMNANETATININLSEKLNTTIIVEINGHKQIISLENGIGQLTVSNLKEGTHIIKAKYEGDETYQTSSNDTATITVSKIDVPANSTPVKLPVVKKYATKITAKKKTFKASKKVKKYTITLKSGKKPVKKVQVTIKIGKKTYKAKTNAKGKATFKIKKLTKKGKYKAVIKFKGNKTYKATSKKVKITIKK